jgi:hypothetical protein
MGWGKSNISFSCGAFRFAKYSLQFRRKKGQSEQGRGPAQIPAGLCGVNSRGIGGIFTPHLERSEIVAGPPRSSRSEAPPSCSLRAEHQGKVRFSARLCSDEQGGGASLRLGRLGIPPLNPPAEPPSLESSIFSAGFSIILIYPNVYVYLFTNNLLKVACGNGYAYRS